MSSEIARAYLEQLGAFADLARGRRRLAHDHRAILRAAVDRVEGKLWWSNVAVGILPGPFTMSEARRVYEAIAGTRYDGATFARDLKASQPPDTR